MTDKFIEYIKNMEEEILSGMAKKREISSLISKRNGLLFLKTRVSDNIKITSNLKENVNLNDFKLNGMIDVIIKINYIWTNETKIGFSCQLYQIKYYAPPEQLDIDFIDEVVKPVIPLTGPPLGPPLGGSPIYGPPLGSMPLGGVPLGGVPFTGIPNKSIIPEQIGVRMVPSIKDLQGALKKLKPVEKTD